VKQVALIYGENLTDTAVTMLVRHWGLLITGAGVQERRVPRMLIEPFLRDYI